MRKNGVEWVSREKSFQIIMILVLSFILFLFFFNFYFITTQNWRSIDVKDDIIKHSDTALYLVGQLKGGLSGLRQFIESAQYSWVISYPVWHLMVYVIYAFCYQAVPEINPEIAIDISSSFINSSCIVLTWLVIVQIMIKASEKASENKINKCISMLLIGLSLIFAGPLDASEILGNYYLGAYSGNLWHNPTYLIMRPCALAVFFLYVKLLKNGRSKRREYLITTVLLAFSAILKPNFFQSFLPGLTAYCIVLFLVRRTKDTFIQCLKIALTCVPVSIVALFQFMASIDQEGGGIGVAFLYVWEHFTIEWELSLIVSIAFPLYVYMIAAIKRRWNTGMTLSLCMLASSLLQYMLFYVKAGPFAGDFSWGVGLSIFFCFIIAMCELLQFDYTDKKHCLLNLSCWALYLLHLIYGIIYFYGIWTRGGIRAPLQMW